MKKVFNKIFSIEFAEKVLLFHLLLLPLGIIMSSLSDLDIRTIINNIYYLVVMGSTFAFIYNYDEEKEKIRDLEKKGGDL